MRCTILVVALLFGVSLSQANDGWTGSWSSAQQIPEPANALPPADLRDATLRQIVHLSAGGTALRIRLSNTFGTAPLHLLAVHVAHPVSLSSDAVDPTTDHAVTFGGRDDVILPAGADYLSDALAWAVPAGGDLAISIHYESAPQQQTGHPGSRATSYLTHGDLAAAASLPHAKKFDHWYQLSGVDVLAGQEPAAIVTLGDSITDGHGATTNGNDRWPDLLAARLRREAEFANAGVLNQGIGGNRILDDGLGSSALARFDRDVLAPAAVRTVIVLEGVNDIGMFARASQPTASEHAEFVGRLLSAYRQLIDRAHAHRLRILGGTLTPFAGSNYYHPSAATEADRQAINAWIRATGHFDDVVDFDRVLRDPSHPDRLLPQFDSGDHLHPSPAGYAAMANSIPLPALRLLH